MTLDRGCNHNMKVGRRFDGSRHLSADPTDSADAWGEAPILVDPSMHPSRYTYLQKLKEETPVANVNVQQAQGDPVVIASPQDFSVMTLRMKQEDREEEGVGMAFLRTSQIEEGEIKEMNTRPDTIPNFWKE